MLEIRQSTRFGVLSFKNYLSQPFIISWCMISRTSLFVECNNQLGYTSSVFKGCACWGHFRGVLYCPVGMPERTFHQSECDGIF